jgi:hypothetical protein
MNMIFPHFNKSSLCPVCNTSDDKPGTLVGIDGTEDGNKEQAIQVHVDCLLERLRYRQDINLFYAMLDNKPEV